MVLKRSAAEEAAMKAALHVQGKKDRAALAEVTERMKKRNLEMAAHLKSMGVELPAYYADVPAKPKRGLR